MTDLRRIRTKDVCAMLGITPPTIRLYERYNDARRYDVRENGYRDFTFQSVSQLMAFRDLSVMGVPLDRIATVMQNPTSESMGDALCGCLTDIDARMEHLRDLREIVLAQQDLIARIRDGRVNEFRHATMPVMYLLECEEDGCMPTQRDHLDLIRSWGDQIPFVRFMAYFPEQPSHYSIARIGLVVDERYARYVSIDSPHVRRIGGCPCVSGIVRVDDVGRREAADVDGYDNYYCSVEQLMPWIEENGYHATGGSYGQLIASHLNDPAGPDNDYYIGWTPVEES